MQKTHNEKVNVGDVPDLGMRHFKAIISLATFKSFLAASTYLEISQPGLSRMIKQAEEKLGFRLFDRSAKAVRLTAQGAEFLPFAEKTLRDFGRQAHKIKLSNFEEQPKVNLSCLMSISQVILPKVIKKFRQQHPHFMIEIHEGVGRFITDTIIEGVVDFGIGSSEFYPRNISIIDEFKEPFVLILPKGHILLELEKITLEDIRHQPLISMPMTSGIRQKIDSEALKIGLLLKHEFTTNQYATIINLVKARLGLSIVPKSISNVALDRGLCVKRLPQSLHRKIAILVHQENVRGRYQEDLMSILFTHLRTINQ